jgi:hypothetical protein
MLVVAALLFVAVAGLAPSAIAGEATRSAGDVPQVVVFDNEDFLGDHAHIFGNMKELGKWGNSISSMIILSGTWEFFAEENFKGITCTTWVQAAENGGCDKASRRVRI